MAQHGIASGGTTLGYEPVPILLSEYRQKSAEGLPVCTCEGIAILRV